MKPVNLLGVATIPVARIIEPFAEPQGWRLDAACLTLTPHDADWMFFPANGKVPPATRLLCGGCTVFTDCADYADRNRIPDGIYAGEDAGRRRARLNIPRYGDHLEETAAA